MMLLSDDPCSISQYLPPRRLRGKPHERQPKVPCRLGPGLGFRQPAHPAYYPSATRAEGAKVCKQSFEEGPVGRERASGEGFCGIRVEEGGGGRRRQ